MTNEAKIELTLHTDIETAKKILEVMKSGACYYTTYLSASYDQDYPKDELCYLKVYSAGLKQKQIDLNNPRVTINEIKVCDWETKWKR